MLVLSFVVDPLLFGLFPRKAWAREAHPAAVYLRAALRVAALAAVVPRRPTRLTSAGRSQLLAYLLHDAVFAVGAQALLPALLPRAVLRAAAEFVSPAGHDARPPLLTAVAASVELLVYAAVCLATQLLLSSPQGLPRAVTASLAAGRSAGSALQRRARLLALRVARRRAAAAHGYKRVPAESGRPGRRCDHWV